MILTVLNAHFARRFVTPFNAINETAIRSPCGGKAESSGCLQIKSRLLTSRAKAGETVRPSEYRMVDDFDRAVIDRVAPVIASVPGARGPRSAEGKS